MTLSLRARLIIGLVALVLVGLLAGDALTYAALRGSLFDQVDQQLNDAANPTNHYLEEAARDPGGFGPPAPSLPQQSYAEIASPNGTTLVFKSFALSGTGSGARPSLSQPLSNATLLVPFTVSGTGGVSHYRVLIGQRPDGNFFALAIPLTNVEATLRQLLILEISIGAAVLAAMILLGMLLVRVGLRPLERMGHTAGEIAGGQLGRRVEPATPRTEIGRLGLALNSMLAQIESAFAERTRSEQRLRQFLADASHELRTPLTSIRGYAEMLRRGAERSPQDASLARRRIEEEAVRMSTLVDDLLLLARLDQGRPLDRDPVDLRAIAQDAFMDARAVAPGRAISLAGAEEPVVVIGDDMRLRQAVGNLVRNALVHTPTGTQVEIGLARENGHALLTVADHGAGLPSDTAARVFEPFFRADPGRSRDRGGSGLGLSIVAAVVAAHRGDVKVSETAGGGATFAVELPLASSG